MSDSHKREPIKHTCPDIDKYIRWIKMEIMDDRDLQRLDEKDLFDTASSMRNQLEECINYLEELRSSNHELRMWGIEEADEVDSLNNYVEELEGKLNSIKVSA